MKPGDIITHTRCMGCIEEHTHIGMEGRWMVGLPTTDTMRVSGMTGSKRSNVTNDIYAANVTHINRVPVENVKFLDENKKG